MAAFLAKRIVDGYLSFSEVPAKLKEDVRTELEESGNENLANEDT